MFEDARLSLFISHDIILRQSKQMKGDKQPGTGPARTFPHFFNMMTAVGAVLSALAGLDPSTPTYKLFRYHENSMKVLSMVACTFRNMLSVHGGKVSGIK